MRYEAWEDIYKVEKQGTQPSDKFSLKATRKYFDFF